MKAFRISRAPSATGEATHDAFAKLVFEPPLESDELFDALREAYPSIKTHTERKKQAVLEFLMEERQAIEQEITAFVQQTGTPAPPPDVSYSARPSPAFSATSSLDLRKFSTSNSTSSSSSTRSAGSSPETLSLKDMTSVWTAAGHGKPKIHTRRSMTTKEKEEYRRRRQMKACKECRSRKRKCNHDPSSASSAVSPHADAKVKKRTSTAAPSNPHSQQSFLSKEFDNAFLADSFSTDSPMDFLDFSPATGTDGSFDDFLLLPQDDFSSIDFSTDPLFQPVPQAFAYDPYVQLQSQHLNAPSAGSRSPTSTHRSSGMSRSGSNPVAFDTSHSWSFDMEPLIDLSSDQVRHTSFASRTTDAKQAGLAGGLSPTSQPSPATQSSLQPYASPGELQLLSSDGVAAASPGLVRRTQAALNLIEGPSSQAQSSGKISRESRRSATDSTTATHTLNAHTAVDLPGDADVLLHSEAWFNDGRSHNDARRDGMVLGTDPSAGARFGEHGGSLLRRLPADSRKANVAHYFLPESYGDRTPAGRLAGWEAETHSREAPLSSRNPTSTNDPTSLPAGASTTRPVTTPLRRRRSVLSQASQVISEEHHAANDQRLRRTQSSVTSATNTLAPVIHAVSDSAAERALATSRSCKGMNPDRTVKPNNERVGEPLIHGGLLAKDALVVHTRPSSPRDASCADADVTRRSSLDSAVDLSGLVFTLASFVSTVIASAMSTLFYLSSTSHVSGNESCPAKRSSLRDALSSSLMQYSSQALALADRSGLVKARTSNVRRMVHTNSLRAPSHSFALV